MINVIKCYNLICYLYLILWLQNLGQFKVILQNLQTKYKTSKTYIYILILNYNNKNIPFYDSIKHLHWVCHDENQTDQ